MERRKVNMLRMLAYLNTPFGSQREFSKAVVALLDREWVWKEDGMYSVFECWPGKVLVEKRDSFLPAYCESNKHNKVWAVHCHVQMNTISCCLGTGKHGVDVTLTQNSLKICPNIKESQECWLTDTAEERAKECVLPSVHGVPVPGGMEFFLNQV